MPQDQLSPSPSRGLILPNNAFTHARSLSSHHIPITYSTTSLTLLPVCHIRTSICLKLFSVQTDLILYLLYISLTSTAIVRLKLHTMARVARTIDAGSHSVLCCRVTNRQCRANDQASGPVPGRTRSRLQPRAATSTAQAVKTARVIKPPHRSASGTLARPTLSKREKTAAGRRLCRTRLALKKYLESGKFKTSHGRIQFDIFQQIRQLSCLSPTGALGSIPSPVPNTARTPERIEAAKARRRQGPSPLHRVERVVTDEEMDQDYGVLPGEARDRDVNFTMEIAVIEYATLDHQVLAGLFEGDEMDGIWKRPVVGRRNPAQEVAQWALMQSVQARKAQEGAMMDKSCVGIVRKIREMSGV